MEKDRNQQIAERQVMEEAQQDKLRLLHEFEQLEAMTEAKGDATIPHEQSLLARLVCHPLFNATVHRNAHDMTDELIYGTPLRGFEHFRIVKMRLLLTFYKEALIVGLSTAEDEKGD